jgi:signal peptidase II
MAMSHPAGMRSGASHRSRLSLAVWLYATALVVYLVDRLTKLIVESTLAGRPDVVLIPGVLHLNYAENAGGAFSLFGGQAWLFVGATALVVGVVLVASSRLTALPPAIALGLILGGALGNLTDRVVRGPGLSGRVIDFVDFRIWPVFNAADAAIVLGVLLMAGYSFARDRREREEETPDRAPEPVRDGPPGG